MKSNELVTKIKICGLFREEDIGYANQIMPDYIGFVFWKPSRRYVTREQAMELRKLLKPEIQAVGVFVDESLPEIISLLEDGVIDIAQLHGDETEEDIQYLQAVTGKPVMKAVKVRTRYDVEAWMDSSADYLLFDSGMGSGVTFDWGVLKDVDREFFLAGGVKPDNVKQAVETVHPYAVDLSSGVETDGVKDFSKMKYVVEAVKKNSIK